MPEDPADNRAECDGGWKRHQKRQAELERQERVGVGSKTVESGLRHREKPAEADEQVCGKGQLPATCV